MRKPFRSGDFRVMSITLMNEMKRFQTDDHSTDTDSRLIR